MYRYRIPTRYAFKFFYAGVATLSLLIILAVDTVSSNGTPMLGSYEGVIADLTLIFLLFYIALEIINFRDRNRFVDHRYYFDALGIYREQALIINWQEVSEVKVTLETFMDRIPAHRDTTWEPYFSMIRDYSTPELITRKSLSRIVIIPSSESAMHNLVLISTPFSPSIKSTFRKMKRYCHRKNSSASFSFVREFVDDTAEPDNA